MKSQQKVLTPEKQARELENLQDRNEALEAQAFLLAGYVVGPDENRIAWLLRMSKKRPAVFGRRAREHKLW